MPPHLSFFDEAVAEFLDAFELYQQLATMDPAKRDLRTAAKCVRSFGLALEKGCKHALAEIDPHLLISKPERGLLVQLRKDMSARPVPTIFCSRNRFDTINLSQTWQALREIRGSSLDPDVASAFERSLARLVEVRNRAQHGEMYAEPDELLAMLDELLARFSAIMTTLSPEWMRRLSEENGQLLSRLRGIETQVDASWQVLVDYLRRFESFVFAIQLFSSTEREEKPVSVIFGGSDRASSMLGGSDVPFNMATGLFASFLTKNQVNDRHTARSRSSAPVESRPLQRAPASRHGLSPADPPLIPLDPGSLSVPTTSVWLSLYLPQVSPPHLFLSATLAEFRIEFSDGSETEGSVQGKLECAIARGQAISSPIAVEGTAFMNSEWHFPEDIEKTPPKPERAQRSFELLLKLRAINGVTEPDEEVGSDPPAPLFPSRKGHIYSLSIRGSHLQFAGPYSHS